MHMQPQAWNFPVVTVIYLALTIQLCCATSFINIATQHTCHRRAAYSHYFGVQKFITISSE